jgi:hypothetical protein
MEYLSEKDAKALIFSIKIQEKELENIINAYNTIMQKFKPIKKWKFLVDQSIHSIFKQKISS